MAQKGSASQTNRAERLSHGYIYYFDGAGGGGAVMNWGSGLKKGLVDAGYDGAGEIFPWNTGEGVVADQDSSVEYKRSKAGEAAREIQEYAKKYPGQPIHLIGLSAGTAVTVFVLEALPPSFQVDTVVLCGASISSDYDLTKALQRVRDRLYVFTSDKDAVLGFLVPFAGTADRQAGSDPSAGLHGFHMPAGAGPQTRTLYSKVVNIAWRKEFEKDGDYGGHTDAVNAKFVEHHIAPLILKDGPHHVQAGRPIARPAAP
jgi:pimeloyl-ACP methyl ester carboxylesterase